MRSQSSTIVGTLALLLASRVVADTQCVLSANPPAGVNCGISGYLQNEDSFDMDTFDPRYLTPEGCALGCQERGNCVSFYFGNPNDYPFCEWHTNTTAAAGFQPYSGAFYSAYDQACFTCGPRVLSCPGSDGQSITVGAATFDIKCSTDYYGGDLAHYNVDTFEECIDQCASAAGCVAVALNGNNCYLKSSLQAPRSDSNVWGAVLRSAENTLSCPGSNGVQYTSASGENFVVQCGADYYGNDLTAPFVNTLNECLDDCGNTSGCVGVAMHGNYCYMKSALSSPQQNSDVWGAALVTPNGKRDQAPVPMTKTLTPGLSSRRRRAVPETAKLTPGLTSN